MVTEREGERGGERGREREREREKERERDSGLREEKTGIKTLDKELSW